MNTTTTTIWRQIPKFPHNIINGMAKHLVIWFQKPTALLVSGILIILVIMLTLVGGLFFWTYQISSIFSGQHKNQSEIEIARSVMQTMKRMVGSQGAWLTSVQEEYNKISKDKLFNTQPKGNYDDNFIRSIDLVVR